MSALDFENLKESFHEEYGTSKRLVQLASSGDPKALADLGFACLHGVHGFAKDRAKASACLTALLRRYAEIRAFMSLNFHSSKEKAEFLLVFLHLASMLDDNNCRHLKVLMYELCKMASESDVPEAQYNLAQIYQWGEPDVVQQNRDESFKWFKIAAGILEVDDKEVNPVFKSRTVMQRVKFGMISAQANALKALFNYYSTGECPEQKPQHTKALDCLTQAAQKKDPVARRELGKLYMTGRDNVVDINPDRACRWLQKAVEDGDEEAKQLLKACKDKKCLVESTAYRYDDLPHCKEPVFGEQYADMLKERILQQESKPPLYSSHNVPTATREVFERHPDSPTARRYLKAYLLYEKGLEVLEESNYENPSGLTFISQALLLEYTIASYFPQDLFTFERINSFAREVMKQNPRFYEGLLIARMFTSSNLFMSWAGKKSVFNTQFMLIENLIYFIKETENPDSPLPSSPYEITSDYRTWLHILYYWLAALWFVVDNDDHFDKAVEAAEASLNLRPDYYESKLILGVSLFYQHLKRSSTRGQSDRKQEAKAKLKASASEDQHSKDEVPERAKKLIHEFLAEAPPCDRKYPDGHYEVAGIYVEEKNMKKFVEHYELAQDAEEKRLPFVDPTDIAVKVMLGHLYSKFCFRTCEYPACGKTRIQQQGQKSLLRCLCGTAYYCNKKCRKADWKTHKKHCSARKKKDSL